LILSEKDMAPPQTCEFDRDCPLNEVCYAGVTWKKPGDRECDCSTDVGFQRDPVTGECTEISQTGWFWIGFAILFMVC
jgi:hypothetical protein